MSTPHFVILAAGMGTRLGKDHPKTLTTLDNGETILGRQVSNIYKTYGDKAQISVVVGYKMEEIIDRFPELNYIFNEAYEETNTSKSLLKAFRKIEPDVDIIWMNGDVVFDSDLLHAFRSRIEEAPLPTIVVNSNKVGEEEVKYSLDAEGNVTALSKQIAIEDALGESVGINFVPSSEREVLLDCLNLVESTDYFEKAIELSIYAHATVYKIFDITELGFNATEVDFEEDLEQANLTL